MSVEPEIGAYIPLKMVVAFFSDASDKSEGDQDKYWLLGLRALIDLNYEFAAEPQTFRIPLNGNKTANFPPGCLSWTKIGVLNSAGELSSLKINNALTKWKDVNPNRLSQLTADINDSIGTLITSPFFFNYYYNNGYCNLFGVGGGLIQYGECTVDDANQLVVLSPDFLYDSIMFEGIFAPQRQEDYMVPLALNEAIIAFIEWKMKLRTEQSYYGECIKARRRMPKKKATLQNINQVIRESEAMKLRS